MHRAMSEFRSALKAYDLESALASDRGDRCIVINVGHDEKGQSACSLRRVLEQVHQHLQHVHTPTSAATKLYIIGTWSPTPSEAEAMSEAAEARQGRTHDVVQWSVAIENIKTLIAQMRNLEELTWISGLPFMAAIWDGLPISLTKLVLDLGEPVRLEEDGPTLHKSYITHDEMRPLRKLVKLRELRFFRVHESFQPTIWETVFRNTSTGGMRVLDIQMARAPIIRSEEWRKAEDVAGLNFPLKGSEDEQYKGKDGKGVLHYAIGTGEYLDDFAIRKGCIAAGLHGATPIRLWCLKLDGFVVDQLPFEHELSRIVLLTCGEKCIDSGLRAPKTKKTFNTWSRFVNNAPSHCLIQWLNWTGIFDDNGIQRSKLGFSIPQDMPVSTSVDDLSPSPVLPLTKDLLDMKDLDDILIDSMQSGYFCRSPVSPSPPAATSNVSERGSAVPTPTTTSSTTTYSPAVSVIGVPSTRASAISSFSESDMVESDDTSKRVSPASTLDSFENVNPLTYNIVPTGTRGSFGEASNSPPESEDTQKVGRHWGWFSSSS